MTPTVGRIVHFRTVASEKHPESATVAAIITKVNEDGTVFLTCFMPQGFQFFRKNVAQGDGEGEWNWPPKV